MSTARERAMREAGEKFDREQAAADARARAQVAATTASRFLGQHPQFRNLAALTGADIKNSRDLVSPTLSGPGRAGRVTKPASARQGTKPSSAVAGGVKQARPGNPSRFAHFAGMSAASPIADKPVVSDINPIDAAAFVLASGAKARGLKPAALAKPRPPIAADMSTPQGVADFVAASAAKARGQKK